MMPQLLSGPSGFTCLISFFQYSVVCTVECFSLFYLLLYSYLYVFWKLCIGKPEVVHANQTSMCLDPHLNKMVRLAP